jgi:hypothetical protein
MTLTTQSFYQDFSSSTQNERLDNFSPIHQKVQVLPVRAIKMSKDA